MPERDSIQSLIPCPLHTFETRQRIEKFTGAYMDKWDSLSRMLLNTVPHWANCFLTFGLAVERYILICRATDAELLLSRRNRRLFYSLLIFMIVGSITAYIVDFVYYNSKVVIISTVHPSKIVKTSHSEKYRVKRVCRIIEAFAGIPSFNTRGFALGKSRLIEISAIDSILLHRFRSDLFTDIVMFLF